MLWKRQQELFKNMIREESDLLNKKGAEYASDADALANFKKQAREMQEELGLNATPLHALWFLLNKHLSSIKSYIRKGHVLSDEPIKGRLMDARNYLFLAHCLIEEMEAEAAAKKQAETNATDKQGT